MKKTHIIYSIVLLFSFGCSDYLEETPDNRIEANTLDKTAELLVRAYPRGDYFFTDWMTDDVEFINTNSQETHMTDAFMWKELDELDDYNTPGNYWNGAYEAIAQANAALEALENIETEDVDYKKSIKGEALLCRAYAHFMLVSFFSNNYDPATASSDLGVPYITQSENVLIKDYKRESVAKVFELVEKDLIDGIALLSDDYYSGSKRYHFTTTAANAFACRFYMYKREYTESIKYANLILGENTVNTNFIKDFDELGSQSGALAKRNFYILNTDASNILIVEKQVGVGLRYEYGYRTGVQQWNSLFDKTIFGGDDLRGDNLGYYGTGDRNSIQAPKFHEEFYKESLTATTGFPFYVQAVLRGEELVFNRIECNLELGNYNLALNDLNAMGALRHTGATDLAISDIQTFYSTLDENNNTVTPSEKDALYSLMLDEKRKEFIQEGMRWLDIKRHDISISHFTFDGREIILEANDLRKVLQIPLQASSREIVKNPR